jgi:hypothetical protein
MGGQGTLASQTAMKQKPHGPEKSLSSRCRRHRDARSVAFEFEGVLTAPLVAFSWLLLPVTLKATLLGVLLLTSMVPADRW